MVCNIYRPPQRVLLLGLCGLLLALFLASCGQAPSQEGSLQATIGALQTQVAQQPQQAPSPEQQASPEPQGISPTEETSIAVRGDATVAAETPPITPTTEAQGLQPDGRSAVFDNWKITIIDVSKSATFTAFTPNTFTAREGWEFVIVKYSAQNLGKVPDRDIDNFAYYMVADGDYTYRPQNYIRPYSNLPIPPMFWLVREAPVEVPKNATGLKFVLHYGTQIKKLDVTFDLNNQFQDPGYTFPKDTNTKKIGDELTVPKMVVVQVSSIDVGTNVCTATLTIKNISGYDLLAGSGGGEVLSARSGPQAALEVEIDIFQEDGSYIHLKPTGSIASSYTPPGSELMFQFSSTDKVFPTDCQPLKTSKMVLSILQAYLTEEPLIEPIYAVYDLT